MKVVVVGAGLAGLSAACHLAGRGHDVTVVERSDQPGGRAGRLQVDGYTFDTGPTVLTMPGLVDEALAAAGTDRAGVGLRLEPLDPMYRATFADGSTIRVRAGREAMRAEIEQQCGRRDAAGFDRMVAWLTDLYETEIDQFIGRNFEGPLDLLRPIGPALHLLRLGGFSRLGRRVASMFGDERLRRLFSFQAMYAGLAPYEALAVYGVITYMDTVAGVYFPAGGMHEVPRALADAAAKAGADLAYGEDVERILTGPSGRVTGVALAGGRRLTADAVVATPDLPVAYRYLVGDRRAPRRARTGTYSPSCILWHAGVRGDLPEGAAHHNIHFGAAWESAFRAVLGEGRRMPDPSTLVTVPTVDEPAMGPPGGHVLYALEPVPNLDGRVDWAGERDRALDQLRARVAALGYPTGVETEVFVDPLDWQRMGMERGTPFALAHRFLQSGPFRPANTDSRLPGLVFAGSSTVPGVGVPMVLISGRLAAERVEALAREAA